MRTVFGYRTTLAQRNSLHVSLGDEIADGLLDWLGSLSPIVPVSHGALANDTFAWSGTVEFPGTGRDELVRASATGWVEGGQADVGLQVLSTNSQSSFRTIALKPGVIANLPNIGIILPAMASANGRPRIITINRAKSFVDELLSPQREIPVVVIASNQAGKSSVRPAELAASLTCLAQVAHVQSTPVIETVAKAMGTRLAIEEGDVRIYWPGLTTESSEHLHRRFKPDSTDARVDPAEIYEAISRVISNQFRPDARVDRFIANHAGTWPIALPGRLAVDEATAANEQDIDEPIVLDSEDSREQYHALLLANEMRIERLESELFEANERLRQHALSDRYSLDSAHQFALISDVLQVADLGELVLLFETHVPDSAIIFLPEAHDSAKRSPYTGGLLGPARLLEAVCSVATRYHFGNLHEGEDFKRAFQAAGEATFASDSSESTLAKYRAKYSRSYDDGDGPRQVLLRPHISFGSGRAHSSVKIYWHVDERNRRFVIGQIGEHLPIASR